ncbi:VOC family protein [Chitinolyticbacter meiyuanensis]|uniref:VOC family protein n=1 Tax=Chitinolyticbacter meiyuanensis TaxID=682798 RepID=UPI0011E5EE6C|nr:glyoxalase superfamily protein [Chitinolyticbacter meiyuanensis]
MPAIRFEKIAPIFTVDNVAQAIDFYRKALEFDLAWSWGTPPEVAAICRDEVEITLTQRADAKPAGASHIYLTVSGIDALYARLAQSGICIVVPLADRDYGMRDFRIADASGNEISIGQAIDQA